MTLMLRCVGVVVVLLTAQGQSSTGARTVTQPSADAVLTMRRLQTGIQSQRTGDGVTVASRVVAKDVEIRIGTVV